MLRINSKWNLLPDRGVGFGVWSGVHDHTTCTTVESLRWPSQQSRNE